jgi:DNA modification methylase
MALTIEQIPIGQLKPNPKNPRLNDEAVDAVARSIQEFGFNVPIVTDADLNIAAGHTRLKAAHKLGLETVPVIRVPELVGSKFSGFMIADNRTGEIAEWDEKLLAELVESLNKAGDLNLASLGFDDAALSDLLDFDVEDEDDKADEAPPLPAVAVSRPGDLYILDSHRLLVGDATNPEDYRRLLAGEQIACLLTDPPYGIKYTPRGQRSKELGPILNDDLAPAALEGFLLAAFTNVARHARSGATAYVFHALGVAGVRPAFERAFLSAGFHLSATLTWVKQSSTLGHGDYRHRSEPILYGWRGEGHRRITDRTESTVWEIPREPNLHHVSQKPVALLSRAIRNSTVRGELVLDPFIGSGSTLICCEQLGRRCFALELDPRYCDVCVARWEKYTGRKAELIRTEPVAMEEVTPVDGN